MRGRENERRPEKGWKTVEYTKKKKSNNYGKRKKGSNRLETTFLVSNLPSKPVEFPQPKTVDPMELEIPDLNKSCNAISGDETSSFLSTGTSRRKKKNKKKGKKSIRDSWNTFIAGMASSPIHVQQENAETSGVASCSGSPKITADEIDEIIHMGERLGFREVGGTTNKDDSGSKVGVSKVMP